MRIPGHEATTAQLGAAYPFVASRPLPVGGVLVGRDRLGSLFVHDPFELYAAGVLTNPNMVVVGQIGRGKSAFVKTYLYRHAALGRRVVVLDPKGEYGPLADALGVVPIRLRPDGPLRLNPLDVPMAASDSERSRLRLELCAAISAAALGRDLSPLEHSALEFAIDAVMRQGGTPTLARVVASMLQPSPLEGASSRSIALDEATLVAGSRDLALELRRLVYGELRGMFDGETSDGVDLRARAVILDLSSLYQSSALGVLITCAMSAVQWIAGQAAHEPLTAQRAEATPSLPSKTILVVDEAWAVLANLGVARFLQSSWKLARARGFANIAVVHRMSDLAGAGGEGSEVARLATGLVADSETIVCYAQPAAELSTVARLLSLSTDETEVIGRLGRGVALWRVGGRSFLVEHRLAPAERQLVDTDRAMRGP